jgi:hypothetical protein
MGVNTLRLAAGYLTWGLEYLALWKKMQEERILWDYYLSMLVIGRVHGPESWRRPFLRADIMGRIHTGKAENVRIVYVRSRKGTGLWKKSR